MFKQIAIVGGILTFGYACYKAGQDPKVWRKALGLPENDSQPQQPWPGPYQTPAQQPKQFTQADMAEERNRARLLFTLQQLWDLRVPGGKLISEDELDACYSDIGKLAAPTGETPLYRYHYKETADNVKVGTMVLLHNGELVMFTHRVEPMHTWLDPHPNWIITCLVGSIILTDLQALILAMDCINQVRGSLVTGDAPASND